MVSRFLLLTVLLLSVNACSYFPNLGKNEEIYGNKEDRVSILKTESNIKVDSEAARTPPKLPKIRFNNKWSKSHGYDSLTPENIEAPIEFNFRAIESIGKGTPKSVKYNISPVIAENKIFTIDNEGVVTAFDANDIRNELWKYEIEIDKKSGNFSSAGMLYDEGYLYISTGFNKVVALNAESGKLLWNRNINGVARSAPDAHNGVLLVSTAENKLYALDITDGAILWTHNGTTEEISVLGTASPVAYKNLVFASYSSGELYALNIENGNILWFDSLSTVSDLKSGSFVDIDATPVVIGDKTFAINRQGVLAAYETFSGHRLWDIEVGGGKNLWYADNIIYLINDENMLIAINTELGGIAWMKQLPEYEKPERKVGRYYWAGPVLAQDRLLIVGYHGELLSLSPINGDILDVTKVLSGISHPPVVAYNSLYMITEKGKLTVYKYIDKAGRKSLTEKYVQPQ
ncbi:MAG: hypothetical protein COV35_02745 [Alphaproteobacteria bacterium CG11_big_fil_rev_8_21_14_0_20_39_49]|nr:MAG: hypothetical protein COV35_02745 [Alphaproteobacteria bacterium CG11_big_fil_rev_8_21_14_0_20_39_49]